MSEKKNFAEFTNLYPIAKTLKFKLIPQGKTLDFIEERGFLEQDEKRADDYNKAKKIIDKYHKYFIEEVLSGLELNPTDVNDYCESYSKKDRDNDAFDIVKKKLRESIEKSFSSHAKYKDLFKDELIKKTLIGWPNLTEEEKEIIGKFSKFTTYFKGFHENRKNIYSNEEQSTAISYRIIHENLPKFIDNMNAYKKIEKSELLFNSLRESLVRLLDGHSLNEVFSINFFTKTLNQSGIDWYNCILGGKSLEKEKIKGINEYINEYNQKNDKDNRLPLLKPLFKQILSDSDSLSFVLDIFENDSDVISSLSEFQNHLIGNENEMQFIQRIKSIFEDLKNNCFKNDKIYVSNKFLDKLSSEYFGRWDYLRTVLEWYYEKFECPVSQEKSIKPVYIKDKEKWLKSDFSINIIENTLLEYIEIEEDKDIKNKIYSNCIPSFLETRANELVSNFNQINKKFGLLDKDGNIKIDSKEKESIKVFLDSIMDIFHLAKLFKLDNATSDKDIHFYTEFDYIYSGLSNIIPLYNKTRNYLTKKPYSLEKIKLNFNCPTLLNGWDKNKEEDNLSVLFEKEGNFYLGIMNADKESRKVFSRKIKIQDSEKDIYNKVIYKLLPGPHKMLPKVFFAKKPKAQFNPSQELLDKYDRKTHLKGSSFNIEDCHNLIDFFKNSIKKHPEWRGFDFNFSSTKSYEDISSFYREVSNQGYQIKSEQIPSSYINQLVSSGKLYFFKIYNKDFSEKSNGSPNLHTLYWKALFSQENIENVCYKLNGEAEIFFRKKSIEEVQITHPANEPIKNKNPLNNKEQSQFKYDLIKNKRFTEDSFHFHVPITFNFQASGKKNINDKVNGYLKERKSFNIIGIDRGERHLLYLTVVDETGKLIEQYSFNEIINEYNGNIYKTNYHQLLEDKEVKRQIARKDWSVIENIKELKEGYISQVVHKIVKLMVKHNAIIALEDLNSGFKNSRIKVEKQVYQKFEKMLIDKLNFLLFKSPQENEPGLYNALQLTNKFTSFREMQKQNGFLFFVPPWNTSKIDPMTGFVDFLKPKYQNINQAKDFFKRFDSIAYNSSYDWFEFEFDYRNFINFKGGDSQRKWIIATTNDERFAWERSQDKKNSEQKKILVTQELKKLFEDFNIKINVGDLQNNILQVIEPSFFQRLIKLLSVTLALRHNNGKKGEEERDYILSPVINDKKEYFNSLNCKDDMPKNADANGAYNIARKGLWFIREIKKDAKKRYMTNEDWLIFVQKKNEDLA